MGEVVGRIGWDAVTLVCRECYVVWVGVVGTRDTERVTCVRCGTQNITQVEWLDAHGESLREFKDGRWIK